MTEAKKFRTQEELEGIDLTNPPEEKRLEEGEYEMEVRSARSKEVETKYGLATVINVVLSATSPEYNDCADVWAEFWSDDDGLRNLNKFLRKLNVDVEGVKPEELDDRIRGALVNVIIKMKPSNKKDGKFYPKAVGFKKVS